MLADCYKNSLARISADGTVNHSLQTLVAQLQVANEQVQTLSLKNNILEHALNNGVATRLDHLPSERSHFQAQVEGFQSQGLPEMASELNQSFGTQSSKLVASNAVNNLRFEIRPLAKLTGLTPENKRQQATTSKRARWAFDSLRINYFSTFGGFTRKNSWMNGVYLGTEEIENSTSIYSRDGEA
ncbi:hypothetical protein Ocin01_19211 [Orchesella cincta]|uniref:Uncharacterized protein n=1 Tax=Orchesella cincta TaxID=48709 RepID=A0A1D2M3I7_ORCCI|nr:hypothetical protein Ocin01_19211 [Orchesella cincta]